jgi:aspartate aminotransferase-like enzyme
MYQVDEGLRLMQAEGDGVYRRHEAAQAMSRAGLRALGFELLADDAVASKTVTAAWIPETLDWKAFNGSLKRNGLVLAGGQGKLQGRIFRLGHLGSVTTDDILAAIGVLEQAAIEQGLDVRPGAAVAAAQQALVAARVRVAVPA